MFNNNINNISITTNYYCYCYYYYVYVAHLQLILWGVQGQNGIMHQWLHS